MWWLFLPHLPKVIFKEKSLSFKSIGPGGNTWAYLWCMLLPQLPALGAQGSQTWHWSLCRRQGVMWLSYTGGSSTLHSQRPWQHTWTWLQEVTHNVLFKPLSRLPYSFYSRINSFIRHEKNVLFVPLSPFSIAYFHSKHVAHFPDATASGFFFFINSSINSSRKHTYSFLIFKNHLDTPINILL